MKNNHSLFLFTFLLSIATYSVSGQSVTNGSVTGSPAANSGINNGNAAGWSGCNFSPDLCDVGFASYSGGSSVAVSASPDGGTWLGMASLEECAQTSITGLTSGNSYTLYFCGANFGSGSSIFYGGPGAPRITIGGNVQSFSIPQAANTWGGYSMSFTATSSTMTLQIQAPNVSGSYSNAGSYYVGLDGFSLVPSASSCTVLLNVEWTSIKAIIQNNKTVKVSWGLAKEKDSDYFEIQRSLDGATFETIGEQKAAGNSSTPTNYQYDDRNLPAAVINDGGPLYYRLKYYHTNGTFSYSAIAVVTVKASDAPTFSIYPNPVNDQLTLDVQLLEEETANATVRIFSSMGQQVHQQQLTLDNGRNLKAVDVNTLGQGIYILEMYTERGLTYQRKFVISRPR